MKKVMYMISAYFDEKTNRILSRYINKIAEVTDNHFMTENKIPPHLTISAFDVKDEEQLMPQIKISRFYRPMQWLPHITLGKKMNKEQMRKAFTVMQEQFMMLEGEVVSLGLAKTNPHIDIIRISY